LISFWFLFIRVRDYRWISAQDALQMPAIYGLAANIVKKVLKINDFC
jgi:hypothetical protein